MAYLTSARIARIRAQISRKEAQRDVLDAQFLTVTSAQSYRMNDGEGSISTEYRSAHEIRNNIRILDAEIESLHRKLAGRGVVSMQVRRRE